MAIHNIIDSARDILVGKLPNPQDQIDTITYTLMYKFMSDIDDASASLGGKRVYFQGDYEKYGWHNLMRSDGQQQLILFRDAIESMNKNPNLPQLFREIFSGALLKFNDPRTLRLFLKEMDKFMHGENDDLGDAYEYLLSIMSSQGGLGQFRTPRHIIEFIVQLVNPDKNNQIIDPACGTSGFLIAAYKHIMAMHDGKNSSGQQNNEQRLTAQELERIHKNFRGFDIDSTMIRTARVNMYLHGFKTPDIIEHDTLTSEDYWNNKYDVILANPPFMTPKGGIQPHKKFSVQANRSEVLFTDYIATHLKPRGRAGFIVPEGIIFQSGNAYKQLRKNLVEQNGLVAVISLPGGVFQPYSGVKTSILYLDPELARQRDTILFIKIENDGYSLGVQRRPIEQNDLPMALALIRRHCGLVLRHCGLDPQSPERTGDSDFHQNDGLVTIVKKKDIAKNGEYNLSGDRYGKTEIQNSKFKKIKIGDIVNTVSPPVKIAKSDYQTKGKYPIIDQSQDFVAGYTDDENALVEKNEYVVFGDHTKVIKYVDFPFAQGADGIKILKPKEEHVTAEFLYHVMCYLKMPDKGYSRHWTLVKEIQIPLPPLSVQKEIIAKIAVKQKAIEAAREVIANLQKERAYFNPHPAIDWKTVKLGEVFYEIKNGKNVEQFDGEGKYKVSRIQTIASGVVNLEATKNTNDEVPENDFLKKGDILFSHINSLEHLAKTAIFNENEKVIHGANLLRLRCNHSVLLPEYAIICFKTDVFKLNAQRFAQKAVHQASINTTAIKELEIPLPPLSVQQEYVEMFRKEQAIIAANKACIAIMNERIKDTLSELYDNE